MKISHIVHSIGHAELDVLGHVLGGGSIKPQYKKLEKILSTRRSETKNALRSFLGTIGYYQKFIDNHANKAKPLTYRLKKRKPSQVRWDDESSGAVEALNRELTQKPILKLPNFRKQFELRTDESDGGLGAVLSQEHDDMNMPVMYVSRKLREAKTRYSTIERKCLGLFWATQRLHFYLYGTEFILETAF